jgi:hypothetical protein
MQHCGLHMRFGAAKPVVYIQNPSRKIPKEFNIANLKIKINKYLILFLVLYECFTLSLTSRKVVSGQNAEGNM